VTTTRVVLVRHCEPEPDARGRCYGSLDFALSPAGRAAAADVAVPPVDAVVSSPRRRARETAGPIAAASGVTVTVDERWRELDFGELEGLTYEEAERAHPELYERWMSTPTEVTFPGGESYALLRARVVAAVDELRAAHAGRTVCVVTHGGPIRAALAACLRMPDAAIFRLALDYGSVSIVDWLGDEPLVRGVNR
jgi:broad specificity phosphatase PhoE